MHPEPQPFTADAPTMPDPQRPSAGNALSSPGDTRLFNRYRVECELGRGGMGVVLLAQDEELGHQVALKVLPEAVARDPESIAQLKAEVLRGMALQHSGIVRVHTFQRDENAAAIVMEYVSGSTLADLKLRQPGGCFDVEQIEHWVEQLCEVLDYAHDEAHIAHRDLKPRNLMLNADGRLKVADFGLAAVLSESLSRTATDSHCVGTPPYMSPQQVQGRKPTSADDIYALGATIYELLTTRPPFFRGDIFGQVLRDDPPTMTARREELCILGKAPIPRAWEIAVSTCLAKEPSQRPANGAAFLALLREGDGMPEVAEIRIQRPAPAAPQPIHTAPPPVAPEPAAKSDTHKPEPQVEPASDPNLRWQEPAIITRKKPVVAVLVPAALAFGAAFLAAGLLHIARHRSRPESVPAPHVASVSTPAPSTPRKINPFSSNLQPAKGLDSAK